MAVCPPPATNWLHTAATVALHLQYRLGPFTFADIERVMVCWQAMHCPVRIDAKPWCLTIQDYMNHHTSREKCQIICILFQLVHVYYPRHSDCNYPVSLFSHSCLCSLLVQPVVSYVTPFLLMGAFSSS